MRTTNNRSESLYLKQSKDGWWGYRRVVPKKLRKVLGKREWKKAYKTKSLSQALLAHAEYFNIVESEIHSARKRLSVAPTDTQFNEQLSVEPTKKWRDIYKKLHDQKRLPHQAPKLDVTASEKEQICWAADMAIYAEEMFKFDNVEGYYFDLDSLIKKFSHPKFKEYVEHRDYIRYIEQEYELLDVQQSADENNTIVIHRRILAGDYVPPEPTIETLLNHYLDAKRLQYRNGERNRIQQQNLEKNVTRYVELLANAHVEKMLTPLSDLDISATRAVFEAQYPRLATRKRNLSDLRAAIRGWNRDKPSQKVDDIFNILIGEIPKDDPNAKTRAVWQPNQFRYFWDSIRKEQNPEIKVVGMLLAYAGKPQKESAGLVRKDVVLNSDAPPHIHFRNNDVRVIAKKRQDMLLPLVGEMLSIMREYIEHFEGTKDDPLFPSLTNKHSADLSKALLPHHPKETEVASHELFDSYGLRHTFKVRYEKAGVSPEIGMYLFGHKHKKTTRIHQSYAGGVKSIEALQSLEADMKRIDSVTDWSSFGYFSDFND